MLPLLCGAALRAGINFAQSQTPEVSTDRALDHGLCPFAALAPEPMCVIVPHWAALRSKGFSTRPERDLERPLGRA